MMARDKGIEPDVSRARHHFPHTGGNFDLTSSPAHEPLYPNSTSLLSDPGLKSRGNGPVRIALMRQAQQSSGNRALRNRLSSLTISRQTKTKGEAMVDKADAWLDPQKKLKDEADVLKNALSAVKAGKSVKFNRTAGIQRAENAAKILGMNAAATTSFKSDWEWLVDNRKLQGDASYQTKEKSFFNTLKSPLTKLGTSYPKAQAEYWLRNTPSQVVDVIYSVADADIPADQLYTYAASEGLIDIYIRPQMALKATDSPNKAQLAGVSTGRAVSGFDALGLDDFMTDMNAKREPLKNFLPPGYDPSKAIPETNTNEKGRTVQSATFTDIKTALQALLAMLKRRRTLFMQDATAFGYAKPTEEELIYWTNIYHNAGEPAGRAQLKKYKGTRKLSDWITKGEYPNSIKTLESYKMLKAMNLF